MQLSKIVYIVAFKRYEIRDVISSDRMIYFRALSWIVWYPQLTQAEVL